MKRCVALERQNERERERVATQTIKRTKSGLRVCVCVCVWKCIHETKDERDVYCFYCCVSPDVSILLAVLITHSGLLGSRILFLSTLPATTPPLTPPPPPTTTTTINHHHHHHHQWVCWCRILYDFSRLGICMGNMACRCWCLCHGCRSS